MLKISENPLLQGLYEACVDALARDEVTPRLEAMVTELELLRGVVGLIELTYGKCARCFDPFLDKRHFRRSKVLPGYCEWCAAHLKDKIL